MAYHNSLKGGSEVKRHAEICFASLFLLTGTSLHVPVDADEGIRLIIANGRIGEG